MKLFVTGRLQPGLKRCHMGILLVPLILLTIELVKGQLLPCPEDAVTFALTQCDEGNGLWRITVPLNDSLHCIPKGRPPLRIHNCETSCTAGYSYSLETLNCSQCNAGTYSVGNAQTYEDWHVLPPGFRTQSAPLLQRVQQLHSLADPTQPLQTTCSEQTWLARGDYVALEESEDCISRLSLEVDIVQEPGYVEFEYQFPESSLIFIFSVISAECGSASGKGEGAASGDSNQPFRVFPEQTMRTSWSSNKVLLQKGKQTLVWMGVSMTSSQGSTYKPVRIRRVQVVGVKYSKSCTACPAGTYSSAGASRCEDCPLNHISGKGAGVCSVCPGHQYALPGFLRCFDRIPCTEKDCVRRIGPCNDDGTADVLHDWITPKICEDLSIATVLPAPSKIPCPRCSRGTYRFNSTTCGSCEPGQFVDGQGKCQRCDSGTIPAYKYEFVNWDFLPSNIDAFCWNSSGIGCAENGWQLNGDSISSGFGHEDDVLLVMQLSTAGFRKIIQPGLYGQLSFEFDMICKSPQCQMEFLLEDTDSYGNTHIKTWIGPQPRQRFQYLVSQNASLAFTWLFVKTSTQSQQPSTKARVFGQDVFRIFSINLTNTVDGGADSCEPCAAGSDPACLRCGSNEMWNSQVKKCFPCPANSVVSEVDGSCVACGSNLLASGKSCLSNCRISLQNGKKEYDMTALKGHHQASTQHFFHVGGEEYFHLYNISFCQDTPAVCSNSLRKSSSLARSVVSGSVCRTTHLSAGDHSNSTTSMQSFVSGHELFSITEEANKETGHVENLFSEIQTEFSEKLAPDFFYHFRSFTPTSSCPSGRSTIITMRCSKNTTSMHDIRVPSGCSEGTCDGCVYRLMWLTPFACPICGPDDYNVVRGECSGGSQKIYYHSKAYCHETNSTGALIKQVPCHSVPFYVEVLMVTLSVSGMALIILVLVLYKNATKYKHRYMKLVQDASGVIHLQLPESCVDDHDLDHHADDDDARDPQEANFNVEFKTPSQTIYTKVKKAVTKKRDLHRTRIPIRGFQESEENELLAE